MWCESCGKPKVCWQTSCTWKVTYSLFQAFLLTKKKKTCKKICQSVLYISRSSIQQSFQYRWSTTLMNHYKCIINSLRASLKMCSIWMNTQPPNSYHLLTLMVTLLPEISISSPSLHYWSEKILEWMKLNLLFNQSFQDYTTPFSLGNPGKDYQEGIEGSG